MDEKKNGTGAETPPDAGNEKKERKGIGALFNRVARDFFLGCLAFVPFALFAFIIYYVFIFFQWSGRIFFGLTSSRETSFALLVFVALLVLYTGRKLRRQEKWFLNFVEQGIIKIPILGGWYELFRDMVQTFTAGGVGGKHYLGTARVPFGTGYIIGFVTRRDIAPDGTAQVTIFVPTSPNPTTGLVFFFPEESVSYLDLSPEQAFTKVISLGMKA
ncbi:DUF502 domain-containing protein [Synergistaceae bacterium OttesenSCG-928-D05]|nr:DUF502 domain-containing protein [Synergistaceae bacterium OttesenSCG-928-D05]